MDGLSELFWAILSLSVGGISVGTILTTVIYVVKSIRKSRKEQKLQEENIKVTKEQIEQSFKEAVLPKTIKLDVSTKIEQPIKQGLQQIRDDNKEALESIHEENRLILTVLSKFTHVQKLSKEDQEAIADIVGKEVTEEIQL